MPELNQLLTPHEAAELHELIGIQVMEIKKLKATIAKLPEGSELASYIDDVIMTKEQHIGEFKRFFSGGALQ